MVAERRGIEPDGRLSAVGSRFAVDDNFTGLVAVSKTKWRSF